MKSNNSLGHLVKFKTWKKSLSQRVYRTGLPDVWEESTNENSLHFSTKKNLKGYIGICACHLQALHLTFISPLQYSGGLKLNHPKQRFPCSPQQPPSLLNSQLTTALSEGGAGNWSSIHIHIPTKALKPRSHLQPCPSSLLPFITSVCCSKAGLPSVWFYFSISHVVNANFQFQVGPFRVR